MVEGVVLELQSLSSLLYFLNIFNNVFNDEISKTTPKGIKLRSKSANKIMIDLCLSTKTIL